jgi:hypothetical protein
MANPVLFAISQAEWSSLSVSLQQVPGGPRIEGALFVHSKHHSRPPHVTVKVSTAQQQPTAPLMQLSASPRAWRTACRRFIVLRAIRCGHNKVYRTKLISTLQLGVMEHTKFGEAWCYLCLAYKTEKGAREEISNPCPHAAYLLRLMCTNRPPVHEQRKPVLVAGSPLIMLLDLPSAAVHCFCVLCV